MTDYNRNDLRAGRISLLVTDGVTTSPAGRINCLTLAEHQGWNIFLGKRPLSEAEARLVGHREDEITSFWLAIE